MRKGFISRLAIRPKRLVMPKLVRRFARGEDGVAAIEYGLLMTPFFVLLFAVIETAIVFLASQTLETAVADSARLIMTGQAQKQGFDQAAFKQAVCAKIQGLFNCSAGLKVDVRTYTSYGSATPPAALDANGNITSNLAFQPGGPGDIVVVRLMYAWPVYVNLMNFNLDNMAGSNRLIVATATVRNEPYQ